MDSAPNPPGHGNEVPDGWPGLTQLNAAELPRCAVAYGSSGLPIFPTFGAVQLLDGTWACECGDAGCDRKAKHPRVQWTREATTDAETISAWWSQWPNSNIAMPTGSGERRSGFVVIDLDTYEEELEDGTTIHFDGADELRRHLDELGIPWPATLEQQTPGGGQHLWFTDPVSVTTGSNWLPGVDLRGDGGYVLLAPSRGVKRGGSRYAWLNERAPQPAPERLATELRVARGTARRASGGTATPGGPEYDYSRSKAEGPPAGARDQFFNAFAFELRKNGLTWEAAVAEFRRVFDRTPQPPRDPFHWKTAEGKLRRVWDTVQPDPGAQGVPAGGAEVIDILTRQPVGGDGEASGSGGAGTGGGGGGGGEGGEGGDGGDGARVIVNGPPGEGLTDLGNALRARRLYLGRMHFVHDWGRSGLWVIWDGTRFRPDGTGRIVDLMKAVIADIRREAETRPEDQRNRVLAWATASEASGRIEAMIKLLKAEPGIAVTREVLDAQKHLVNFPNGTLDLTTGELREHRPEDKLTRMAAVDFDPAAESDLLDEFENLFLPDAEEREYVYRTLGSALHGGNLHRLFVVIIGGTTSGKTMLSETIGKALGDYASEANMSVFRGVLDDKPRPDLLWVMPSRLVVVEEASSSLELHSDQLKRLTGGAGIVARGMQSDTMVERRPDFTPVIVTNKMPHVKDADAAIKRRLIALHFRVSLSSAQEDVTKKPVFVGSEEVQRAVVARLVAGYHRAVKLGVGAESMPLGFAEATMRAFEDLDDVALFLNELVDAGRLESYLPETVAKSACVSTSELHGEYVRWIKTHGSQEMRRNQLGPKQFGDRLVAMGWERVNSGMKRWAGKVLKTVSFEPRWDRGE